MPKKSITRAPLRWLALALIASLGCLSNSPMRAQVPWGAPPTTPSAQINARNTVTAQVNWLLNATQNAPNYGANGYGMIYQQFTGLQGAFNQFGNTLTQQQLNAGANDLAELSSGLSIIGEAFQEYQQDLADGRAQYDATLTLCNVMQRAVNVWVDEFKRDCNRLHVGW